MCCGKIQLPMSKRTTLLLKILLGSRREMLTRVTPGKCMLLKYPGHGLWPFHSVHVYNRKIIPQQLLTTPCNDLLSHGTFCLIYRNVFTLGQVSWYRWLWGVLVSVSFGCIQSYLPLSIITLDCDDRGCNLTFPQQIHISSKIIHKKHNRVNFLKISLSYARRRIA